LLGGREVNARHLEQVLDFFENFIGRCRHGKEEMYLFPAMDEAGIKKSRDRLSRILEDHGRSRVYIKGMKVALRQYNRGADRANLEFAKYAKSYITLMRRHMAREDKTALSLGGKYLTGNKQGEPAESPGAAEEGADSGRQELYYQLLKKLKGIYLLN
jgi:hemerythrin-like domain-containing protein